MTEIHPQFKRILLKLSGEVLMGKDSFGIDPVILKSVAAEISAIHNLGVQVAIVIGGGNIFRGLQSDAYGVGRVAADHMGMLATIINALALSEALQHIGTETRIMSAINMRKIVEPYVRARAVGHLSKKRIVIFGAGTGNPYFTTDTAAALRANEIQADVLFKATKVDGVFTADPMKDPEAQLLTRLTYIDVLRKNLRVMDAAAISLCMENRIPIQIFNVRKAGILKDVVMGAEIGSLIEPEEDV